MNARRVAREHCGDSWYKIGALIICSDQLRRQISLKNLHRGSRIGKSVRNPFWAEEYKAAGDFRHRLSLSCLAYALFR